MDKPLSDEDAAKRRATFQKFLDDRGITPTKVAREAGFPTANIFFNFLHGRTKSLSLTTLEKVASAYGITISMFTGEAGSSSVRTITVRAEAQAGRFRPAFDLPLPEQSEVPVPLDADAIASGAFGVTVRGPGTEGLFPAETILTCVPLPCFEQPLASGHKLIVQRTNESGVEVTVRELQISNGKPWLRLRSTRPEFQQAIECGGPIGPRPWTNGDDRFRIVAVVIGSYRSELQTAA